VGNPHAIGQARELLGFSPENIRLISAVHEAGHAVVGHTLGMVIERAHLTDDGSLDGHVTVDYGYGPGKIVPLPDLLTLRAAGFQAMFTWLEDRQLLSDRRTEAINYLAAGDIEWCIATCRDLGMGSVTMQDGIEPAVRILRHRWPTVLRMAYVLAKAGSLAEHEVEPLLLCDPQRRLIALGGYRRWRDGGTAERWYRP